MVTHSSRGLYLGITLSGRNVKGGFKKPCFKSVVHVSVLVRLECFSLF